MASSRRTLGGGRVLGSGRSLSPAVMPPRPHQLTPSESSLSLASSSHTSTTETDDIASRVALDASNGPVGPASAASSRLVCPICNDDMVTLLQLNRHLDDNHQNLQEVEQDEVKNWFEQQMKKAKRFQPLAVLNQKLKGLDVFESNAALPPSLVSNTPPRSSTSAQPTLLPAVLPESRLDPDLVVTKAHWQRSSHHDSCSDPLCGKRLGTTHGNVNCRHCGRLFCEEHTMYQMKLSRSAQHEPVRGLWCRVCETCYKSRPGYNDHSAPERDHTKDFVALRRRTVDKAYLEVSRLEKRLSRLTQLLAHPPPPDNDQSTSSFLWSLAGSKNHTRTLEQSVVTWEDDASVAHCPFCQQQFSQYSFRRHHCRICGRVVCGDPATNCSTAVGLNIDAPAVATTTNGLEKSVSQIAVDVRMCKDCQHTIFSKSDFARQTSNRPPDQRAYENLVQFERGIRLLLPKFQKLLQTLQDPEKPPTPTQLADATKVRKRLIDAFTQYDVAARRIRDLPTECSTQERLQKAVYAQATSFLHLHMLPLKSLPKLLQHATPHGNPQAKHSANPLAAIRNDQARPQGSRASSSSSALITALETEEKELRERLIVLEEQKFFVEGMISDANKRRRFDEVASLAGNVEDLNREIDQLQGQIAGMDFAGAYNNAIS
jgi:rabenosyn-5